MTPSITLEKLPELVLVLGFVDDTFDPDAPAATAGFNPVILKDSEGERFVLIFTDTERLENYVASEWCPKKQILESLEPDERVAGIVIPLKKCIAHATLDNLDYLAVNVGQHKNIRKQLRLQTESIN